jgi:hypothetical protein
MDELTQEWLQLFNDDKAKGLLGKSIFWRLAAHVELPMGVDPNHPEVISAIEEIKNILR